MMAPDSRSTPEPRMLADDTMAVLRAAVIRLWEDRGSDDELRDALALLAREARARSLRAEEVIKAFKSLLGALPELHTGARRMEAVAFQERLVTLCIKAYYRIPEADAPQS
jgi:hypothetical protein